MSSQNTLSPLFTWRSAICESDLPATAKHVALTISLYMNERGGSAFPGGSRLARDTSLDLRTVKRALALLEAEGWLTVVHRGSCVRGGRRTANEYAASQPDRCHTTTGVTRPPVSHVHRPVSQMSSTGVTRPPHVVSDDDKKASLVVAQPKQRRSQIPEDFSVTDDVARLVRLSKHQIRSGRRDPEIHRSPSS